MSPFPVSCGYQIGLFPEQEVRLGVPLFRRTSREAVESGRWSGRQEQNQTAADKRRSSAPPYSSGQKVWLSAKDIPLQRAIESQNMALWYNSPYAVDKVTNHTLVRLQRLLRFTPLSLCPVSSGPYFMQSQTVT